MKRCPSCDASNEDDVFYCRECDSPLSGDSDESESREFSLIKDQSIPPTATSPFRHDTIKEPPASAKPRSQPTLARSGRGLLIWFWLSLILLLTLVGAIAYLVYYEDALERKADFDMRLSSISDSYVERIRQLEAEIESVRAQRDQLLGDLQEVEKRYESQNLDLKNRLSQLVEGRIPGAYQLKADGLSTVIEQDIKYTVEFFSDAYQDNVLRYRITLQNTQRLPLMPSPIDLTIFNENGLQVGRSTVAFLDHLANQHIPPGEARVTMGSMRIVPVGSPEFFLFRTP